MSPRRRAGALACLPALGLVFLLLTPLLLACEKPDASHVTSPSAKALMGTTTGNVAYDPRETAPFEIANPPGWDVRLENARFSELENGTPSIQVVIQIKSQAGPGMELWLTDGARVVLRWSGGAARRYDGVVCFQLQLEAEGDALNLGAGPHNLTLAFRDPASGEVVASRTTRVAGEPPAAAGSAPGSGSDIARELLGCPRSVI